jgi:hypothetical protein
MLACDPDTLCGHLPVALGCIYFCHRGRDWEDDPSSAPNNGKVKLTGSPDASQAIPAQAQLSTVRSLQFVL